MIREREERGERPKSTIPYIYTPHTIKFYKAVYRIIYAYVKKNTAKRNV